MLYCLNTAKPDRIADDQNLPTLNPSRRPKPNLQTPLAGRKPTRRVTTLALAFVTSGLLLASSPAQAESAHSQAARAGVRTCLPVIEQIEAYLRGPYTSDAVVFWDKAAVDQRPFTALIELEGPAARNVASLNVSPTQDGQCVAEFSQYGYAEQNCKAYLKAIGDQVRHVSDLGKHASLFQGQGVHILLANAGPGCAWVRKEVLKLPGAAQPPASVGEPRVPPVKARLGPNKPAR